MGSFKVRRARGVSGRNVEDIPEMEMMTPNKNLCIMKVFFPRRELVNFKGGLFWIYANTQGK